MTLPNEDEPDAKSGKRHKGDYTVGKYKPPIHTQWQPGQSGNPKGRPKGRRNLKSELEELLGKKITIRDGDNERKLSLPAANIFAHGVKGAKRRCPLDYRISQRSWEDGIAGRRRRSGDRARNPRWSGYKRLAASSCESGASQRCAV
jgi:hypothetical protein